MFEELSGKLDTVLRKLRGQGRITEANVAETLRELRRVLLDADVNYKVAKKFVDDVLKRVDRAGRAPEALPLVSKSSKLSMMNL
jgi:signal recognition particle GTPase